MKLLPVLLLTACAEFSTEPYWGARTEPFAEIASMAYRQEGLEGRVIALTNPQHVPRKARVECPGISSSDVETTVPPMTTVRVFVVDKDVSRCRVSWGKAK